MTPYAQRHECKFVVPEALAARLRRRVEPFVRPDPHAAVRPDHTYAIASLYLDDSERTLYRETVEGQKKRFKLRVRSYGDANATVFLEIKRRIDKVVEKLRCPIPRQALAPVLAGDLAVGDALPPHQRRALLEFARLQQLARGEPRIVVRYDRQAYVGHDDEQVRVTFDRRLAVVPCQRAEVRVDDPDRQRVPMGGVVLELKFTDRCPTWMLDAVRAFELRRISFSKYCRSVDALMDRSQELAT
jgi:hypothetical protein